MQKNYSVHPDNNSCKGSFPIGFNKKYGRTHNHFLCLEHVKANDKSFWDSVLKEILEIQNKKRKKKSSHIFILTTRTS